MRKSKMPGLGKIEITYIPNTLIAKLNIIGRQHFGGSRNAYIKTELFKIVEKFESENGKINIAFIENKSPGSVPEDIRPLY